MLVKNNNKKRYCIHSQLQGECCCNCAYRYTVVSNGIPISYVCRFDWSKYGEGGIHLIGLNNNGHGMCEMHMFVGDEDKEEIDYEIVG